MANLEDSPFLLLQNAILEASKAFERDRALLLQEKEDLKEELSVSIVQYKKKCVDLEDELVCDLPVISCDILNPLGVMVN